MEKSKNPLYLKEDSNWPDNQGVFTRNNARYFILTYFSYNLKVNKEGNNLFTSLKGKVYDSLESTLRQNLNFKLYILDNWKLLPLKDCDSDLRLGCTCKILICWQDIEYV